MDGPFALGTFDDSGAPSEFDWDSGRMERNQNYRVVRSFVDAQGDEHKVGEEWQFLMSTFAPFMDELSLCVRSASQEEWRIPLINRTEKHKDVIERFEKDYVEKTSPSGKE
jgi:hypothetical protein